MTNEVQRPAYTVPGILHYLQHEWTRFEVERQQWETERAEFQVTTEKQRPSVLSHIYFKARIAFLQGERQGQENLKNALVRRIKMLEYALKQERYVSRKGRVSLSRDSSAKISLERSTDDSRETLDVHSSLFRVKFHKLKYGTEPTPTEDLKATTNEPALVHEGKNCAERKGDGEFEFPPRP